MTYPSYMPNNPVSPFSDMNWGVPAPAPAVSAAGAANPWSGAALKTNPWTGQPDYAAGLASSPEIGEALNTVGAAAPAAGSSLWGGIGDWMDNSGILGKKLADGTTVQGWGSLGLGAATGLMGAYTSMQQLGLAKDTLAFNKQQYAQNFAAQQKTTNAQLEDRQRARVASNPTAFQSVGDYMKKNGI